MKRVLVITLAALSITNIAQAKSNSKERMSKAEYAALQRQENHQLELNNKLIEAVKDAAEENCINLLARGADIETKDAEGTPVLLLALQENHVKVVKALLNAGANPCAVNVNGIFPLAQVTINADKAVPKELDDGQVIYVKDSSKIHTFLAEALLTAGASVDQQDPVGRTALHMASEVNNTDAISFLTDHEANVNIQDKKGRTPLMSACKAGALEAAQVLLAKGADINVTDNDGQTALMLTVETDQLDLVKLLVSKGALIDVKDDFGATAVKIADALGNRNSAEFLRKAKSA